MKWEVLQGDCNQLAESLDDESIDCVVTSPPYFNQRVYSEFFDGNEIGNEKTLGQYVDALVALFGRLRPKLKPTATVYLNLGDKYKNKQLLGVPWKVAFALSSYGWVLRNDIIWHKPNPMPSSAKDRFTPSHEYVFFFGKSKNYYFEQVLEPITYDFRNKRDVWSIKPATANGVHTAVFPEELVEPCIESGCPIGGTVLDPFSGLGTTGKVAKRLGRSYIGFELNPEFAETSRHWIAGADLPKLDPTKSHATMQRAKVALGDDASEEDLHDLIHLVCDVMREYQDDAETFNQLITNLLGFGVSLNEIRRAEDPDGVCGFDEIVDVVLRDPGTYGRIGSCEQSIFETLREGKRPVPTLKDEWVWDLAMDRMVQLL
ncbi:Modification methylase DpnIIB [Stieleria maiorica]|uniref:Methyltransferase n=1 Tax=Stieleria maiorica TaxID=2795974 RepID=A0A5B9MF57_9BACT|nr:site-specific DNA-methyltransferase [Stieleria maiorica]QEF98175.1 Modification methylase DpnIIB [Stieleria maiorica]